MKRTRRSNLSAWVIVMFFSLYPIICRMYISCCSPLPNPTNPKCQSQQYSKSHLITLFSRTLFMRCMRPTLTTYICRCLSLSPCLQTIRRSGLGEGGGGGIKVSRFPQLGGDKSWQCWCPLSRYQEMEICCTETHLYRLTQHTPAPPPLQQHSCWVLSSASKRSIRRFVITEKAPTRAFSWLKASTSVFTFKTLLRHYA